MYGALSGDGKHLSRQDDKFDTKSLIAYMEKVKKKFKKFIEFLDRATQIRSEMVEKYFQQNTQTINIEYFLWVQCSSILLKNVGDSVKVTYYQTTILVSHRLNRRYPTTIVQEGLT